VAEATGVWVYAIAETVGPASLGELSGVGGGAVRPVEAAGLMAIVGDVGLDEYGESALRRNLEDLDWLEAAARAHHRVIDAVGQLAPVVPMRLATVYSDDAGVSTVLAERGADFRQALRRIGTRREWGVKAYEVPPSKTGGAPAGPAAAGPGAAPAAAGAGAGAAYLQRRRSELSAHAGARRAALQSAQQVHGELSRIAAENRMHAPQAPQLTGTREPMILNAAYLLDDGRGDDFAAAVSALAERHPGVRLELTGPWPPYSFAGPEAGAERAGPAGRLGGKICMGTQRAADPARSVVAVPEHSPPPPAPAAPSQHGTRREPAFPAERIALVDLLDRVLAGGVVVAGEVTLSIADVDMVTISLRALVTSVSALADAGGDFGELNR
jgi:Gas vesicle synthesis protein GvpL/GvpF/Gas vesicle protein